MSTIANSLEIEAIKTAISRTITFAQMSNAQKKGVINQLFPDGVAFWYADPKAAVGDTVYGWDVSTINGGGFFFGEVASIPVNSDSAINFKIQN